MLYEVITIFGRVKPKRTFRTTGEERGAGALELAVVVSGNAVRGKPVADAGPVGLEGEIDVAGDVKVEEAA